MPNLRRPFGLKMSTWVDPRQSVNPCVCGCDYLPDDPRISPENLNDGKGNHTSTNDFFFNLLYSLVSVWSHFPSLLSFFHTQFLPPLVTMPFFFYTLSCHNVMFTSFFPHFHFSHKNSHTWQPFSLLSWHVFLLFWLTLLTFFSGKLESSS